MSTHLTLLRDHLVTAQFPADIGKIVCAYFLNEICLVVEFTDALRNGDLAHLQWLLTFVTVHHEAADPVLRQQKIELLVAKDIAENRNSVINYDYQRARADQQVTYGRLRFTFRGAARTTSFWVRDEIITRVLSVAPWQAINATMDLLHYNHQIDLLVAMERYRVKWETDETYKKLVDVAPGVKNLTPVVYERDHYDRRYDPADVNVARYFKGWNPIHDYPTALRRHGAQANVHETVLPVGVDYGLFVRTNDRLMDCVGMYHYGYECDTEWILSLIASRGYAQCLMQGAGCPCPYPRKAGHRYCFRGVPAGSPYGTKPYCPSSRAKRHPIGTHYQSTAFPAIVLARHPIPRHYQLNVGHERYLVRDDLTIVGRETQPFAALTHEEGVADITRLVTARYGPKAAGFTYDTILAELVAQDKFKSRTQPASPNAVSI